jgi:hypothetical protein
MCISDTPHILLFPIVFPFSFKRNHLGFRVISLKKKRKEKLPPKWPQMDENP